MASIERGEPGRAIGGVFAYMLQVTSDCWSFRRGADVVVGGASTGKPGCPDDDPALDAVDRRREWLSTFRLVPWLVIGPGLLAMALATSPILVWRRGSTFVPGVYLYGGALVVITILAHGAAITSIGLMLATWIRRQSRAIGSA